MLGDKRYIAARAVNHGISNTIVYIYIPHANDSMQQFIPKVDIIMEIVCKKNTSKDQNVMLQWNNNHVQKQAQLSLYFGT